MAVETVATPAAAGAAPATRWADTARVVRTLVKEDIAGLSCVERVYRCKIIDNISSTSAVHDIHPPTYISLHPVRALRAYTTNRILKRLIS